MGGTPRRPSGPADAPFAAGAALEFLQRRFGGPCRDQDLVVTVGTSIINVVPRDNERVSLTFVNLGSSNIYISPSSNPSTAKGMKLGPSGGTVAINLNDDSLLVAVEWNAIGDAAGGTLYVLTVRRETVTQQSENV